MKIALIILALATSVIACKNQNSSGISSGEVKNEEKKAVTMAENKENRIDVVSDSLKGKKNNGTALTKDTNTFAVVVMFYSIGEGVENEYITAFEDSISAYSARIGKNIDYEKTSWGREGETDFCLQLFELTTVEKEEFLSQTKMLLKKAKWVNIYENYPCKHRRNR